jgi:TP901 family phage tail tape measure protein
MADKLILEFQAKTDDLDKRLKAVEGSVGNVGKTSKKVASDMEAQFKKVGGQIATAFGVTMGIAAFASVMRGAFNAAKDFEAQMSKVRAISGATAAEMQKLSESAQRLGASTMFTATQVGQLQEEYARLGFSTKEILSATSATLDLAAATGESLATAAQVAGATVRGFGLDASETVRVTDVMAVSFSKSALNMSDFAEGMKLVAPIARAANIPIETTTALLGKLADAGLRGSIAGTALKNLISKLADENSDLSKELGFSVKNTDDLFRAFKQLQTGNIDLTKATELADERSKAAFLTLINGVDSAEKLTVALNDVTGATAEMARIMQDNFAGDVIKASSAWEGFMLQIMKTDSARETVQSFTLAVNGMSRAIRNLGGETNEMIAVIESFDKFAAGFAEGASEYIRRYVKTLEDGGDNTRAFAKAQEQLVYNQGLLTAKEKERLALNENLEKAQKRLESLPFLAKQTREVKANIEALKLKILENERDAGGLAAAIAVYERYIEVLNGAKKGTEELSEASVRSMNRLNAELKTLKDTLQNTEIGSSTFFETFAKSEAKTKELEAALRSLRMSMIEDPGFTLMDPKSIDQVAGDSLKSLNEQLAEAKKRKEEAFEFSAEFNQAIADIDRLEARIKDFGQTTIEVGDDVSSSISDGVKKGLDKALNEFQQYAQAVSSIVSSISQIQANATQAELFMLQDSLDQGLISREEYAEERRKIMNRQANDEKSAATFEAIINGIVAVVNAFKDGGPVLAAITAAGVAAQIAAIQSTPAPKFAEGGYVDAKGHLHGRTHRQGGIHIEAEGGEFITKASQAKKYGHIVEAVNKGTIEKLIAETYVRPAVDAAILNGWGDLQRSVEVNAAFSDHNLLRTMDRHGFAEVKELRKMNVLLSKALRPDLRKGW